MINVVSWSKITVKYAKGRLTLAVQVTDNSSARILDNIKQTRDDGADIAVIAPPYFLPLQSPKHLLDLYQTAIRKRRLVITNICIKTFTPR